MNYNFRKFNHSSNAIIKFQNEYVYSSGVEHGNLRELALARMKDFGTDCRDVRTREVGIQEIHHKVQPYEVELIRRDYVANNGWETFLSYEDPTKDILVGLLRLRKCSNETFRYDLLIIKKIIILGLTNFKNYCIFQSGVERKVLNREGTTRLWKCRTSKCP